MQQGWAVRGGRQVSDAGTRLLLSHVCLTFDVWVHLVEASLVLLIRANFLPTSEWQAWTTGSVSRGCDAFFFVIRVFVLFWVILSGCCRLWWNKNVYEESCLPKIVADSAGIIFCQIFSLSIKAHRSASNNTITTVGELFVVAKLSNLCVTWPSSQNGMDPKWPQDTEVWIKEPSVVQGLHVLTYSHVVLKHREASREEALVITTR